MIRSSLEYERTIRIESNKNAFAGKTDLLERELNAMRQDLAERKKLCDQLTEELRNSKASLRGQESLVIQLEDLRNQNATLRKDYDQMLAMVGEKNERLERLRVKKRLVKAKLREFSTEVQETGGKVQLLQTEIQRLGNENMEWRRR